ncbi:hypothetical protein [Metallosphaera javensis (ex Sakai et al. 2022)]|uniref:hypothetical protein n=1 Tax=Metallosphaera javensis (ex Sakai et al. 2022) TaxID=2775498 RepID=UPI0025883EFE|nr:MAG: hypothetical protein MjAS7_2512 [Metallosphaera javensis (ex Sakai et al. 2022)]
MKFILAMIALMVVIHLTGTIISFMKKAFPKKLGNVIAVYEAIFYLVLVLFHFVTGVLYYVGVLYLVIHVLGGAYYVRGGLGKLQISNGLTYYGIYELVEMVYLLMLL